MIPKNDLLLERRKVRSRAAKRARNALRKSLGRPQRIYYVWSVGGTNHQVRDIEHIRKELGDKQFKEAPASVTINFQFRKRESKRCGRMIR